MASKPTCTMACGQCTHKASNHYMWLLFHPPTHSAPFHSYMYTCVPSQFTLNFTHSKFFNSISSHTPSLTSFLPLPQTGCWCSSWAVFGREWGWPGCHTTLPYTAGSGLLDYCWMKKLPYSLIHLAIKCIFAKVHICY